MYSYSNTSYTKFFPYKWSTRNDFFINTSRVQLFFQFQASRVEFGKSSCHWLAQVLSNFQMAKGNKKHPEQGKQQLHTNNHPNKWKLKHQKHEQSFNNIYMSHWLSWMKHLHWSFSALPSVSHFTLRPTKRLLRILITVHLAKGWRWGGW